MGGPDVWEVARVLREQPSGEEGLVRTAKLTGLALNQVRVAARYYRQFGHEVDAWIATVDREAEELGPPAAGVG